MKNEKKEARPKIPKKRGWYLFFSTLFLLAWTGAAIIVSQLVVGYMMLFILGETNFNQPVWTGIYSVLAYTLAFLLIAFAPILILEKAKNGHAKKEEQKLKEGVSRKELGFAGLPTWTDIGLAPVGLIISLIFAGILVMVFSQFSWFNPEQAQEIGFNAYISGFDRIIAFVTLVVIAPIAEELIFRGWLYQQLKTRFKEELSNHLAIFLSILLVSLTFGVIHGQWNVGLNVFAMSIVLCGLREITGTIYAGILMHMLKNGIAFYLLYVLGIG